MLCVFCLPDVLCVLCPWLDTEAVCVLFAWRQMFSDMPAQTIMATHKQTSATTEEEEPKPVPSGATTFSTGIRIVRPFVVTTFRLAVQSVGFVLSFITLA